MIPMLCFSFLLWAILASAQSSNINPITNNTTSAEVVAPSSSSVFSLNLTNTSTTRTGFFNSTTLAADSSSQTSTATNSTALSSVLSSPRNSTRLQATSIEPTSSVISASNFSPHTTASDTSSQSSSGSLSTLSTHADDLSTQISNTSLPPSGTSGRTLATSNSIGTGLPVTSSSSGGTETSSPTFRSLPSASSNSSTSASASAPLGKSPSSSSKVSPNHSSFISTIRSTDTSATVLPPGTTSPPSTTTTMSYSDEEIDSYLSMTTWDNFGVSSTITSDQTISASQTSNSDWKKNFWLHTEINGQPTDLPVVHCGCICRDTCNSDDDDDNDDDDLWVVYFHVPKIPNIQISLPKLPDFHLGGCIKIKIPVINIDIPLGKCPPVSDNGEHGHSDPDDPKGKNKKPDESDKPSKTSSSDKESSKPTSSSSSSCSGVIVTDYLTRISCPTSGASASQCATAIETGTRSGCRLTGTASVTTTASNAACRKQSWPTSFGPGVGYSQPGLEYGTYTPPAIFQSLTMSFASMTVSGSSGKVGPTTAPPPTTLSTAASNPASSANTDSNKSSSSTVGESAISSNNSTSINLTPISQTESSSSSTTGGTEATAPPGEESGMPPNNPPSITSTQASHTTSLSLTSTVPAPSKTLQCEGNTLPFWVDQEVMKNGIRDFCEEAPKSTDWDDGTGPIENHKRIERVYNNNTNDQVVLLVSSTTSDLDSTFNPITKNDCTSNMTKIFDECPPGQNIPGLDWRHGGDHIDGTGLLWRIVTDREKYNPGICSFLVMERTWSNENNLHWATRISINDAKNKIITNMTDNWDELYYNLEKNKVTGLYSDLEIEGYIDASGREGLRFTVGNQQFNSSTNSQDGKGEKVPRCEVGEWYQSSNVPNRNTTCWVYC